MDYKFTSRSEQDTMELAENIESEKFPGMVICLDGELGSGKTIFVKGFAKSLGIDENITSPTFNIVKEYETGELPLYHMDVYRLEDTNEDIGFQDYFSSKGISSFSFIIKSIRAYFFRRRALNTSFAIC